MRFWSQKVFTPLNKLIPTLDFYPSLSQRLANHSVLLDLILNVLECYSSHNKLSKLTNKTNCISTVFVPCSLTSYFLYLVPKITDICSFIVLPDIQRPSGQLFKLKENGDSFEDAHFDICPCKHAYIRVLYLLLLATHTVRHVITGTSLSVVIWSCSYQSARVCLQFTEKVQISIVNLFRCQLIKA